ncbi:MAG: (Fe-S)-binding protein [Bacteroidia bacterium]|nr:(Fe-S)-binding protein [Bacteroidia bacterium]
MITIKNSFRKTNMIKNVFAPGCALMLYKPELAEKLHLLLNENLGEMDKLLICCHHDPQLSEKTEVINVCPGCDKRFGNDYQSTSTISLWEIIAESDFFPFPDYQGRSMSVIDACPTRDQERVHKAVRTVLQKMNITLVEPKNTMTKSICCGDSFYGIIPTYKVKEQMVKRTSEMPLDDVVVYCVSCVKSVYIGRKRPHYLIDLLFENETVPKTFEPDEWHKELDDYIEKH